MKNFIIACSMLVLLFPFVSKGQSKQDCTLRVQGTIQHPSCQGGMDGSIRLQVSGGAAPYTYRWNSGQETQNISELTSGTYRVTVQDAGGCQSVAAYIVKAEEKVLALQIDQKEAVGGKVLQVRMTGNSLPAAVYVKNLSKGIQAPKIAYTGQTLQSGNYMLEAFTAAGCSVIERVKIDAN